ncbi:hypothetical protein GGG16DRAFT_121768 [Schizophyllum commune]
MLVPSHHDPSGRSKRTTARNLRASASLAQRPARDSLEDTGHERRLGSAAAEVQRARETPPIDPNPASRSASPSLVDEPQSGKTTLYTKLDRVAGLLESALATVITIQDQSPPNSVIYPEHVITVVSSLARRVLPGLRQVPNHQTSPTHGLYTPPQTNTSPTTLMTTSECVASTSIPSHHEGERTTPVSAPPDQPMAAAARRGSPPPATIHDTAPVPPHLTTTPSPPITPAERALPPERFLVLWPGKGPGPAGLNCSPAELINLLNKLYPEGCPTEKRFGGLRWTAAGHLAIYIRPPYTVSQLLRTEHARRTIQTIVNINCHEKAKLTCTESEGRWEHVVLNGMPAQGVTTDAFNKELSIALGDEAAHLRRATVMCADIASAQHTSIRLSFVNPTSAERILRGGIYFRGQYIRTSKYRPRRRHSPLTTSPTYSSPSDVPLQADTPHEG